MKYQLIPPYPQLQDFISHFWVASWEAGAQEHNTNYYVVASSLTEITFAFRSGVNQPDLLFSAVQGHTHLPAQIPVDGFCHLIGVAFYSHAIPGLFHLPASGLNKEFIPLETFLGAEGAMLNERIALAGSTRQRIDILSRYFLSALQREKLADPLITGAIKTIRQSQGKLTVEDLADRFCLSPKQFNRRFKAFSGFSPKMYSRIIRFESAVKNYQPASSFTEAAYRHGYYDQAHFIHDFRSFAGFSPTDFWKLSQGAH